MMKAIRLKDVCPGDLVCVALGEEQEAAGVEEQEGYVDVSFAGGGMGMVGKPNSLVVLVHRSWPEGKTEADMLDEIFALASSLPGRMFPMSRESMKALRQKVAKLREAIEAYELGKPQEPERNESLVDRHMIP